MPEGYLKQFTRDIPGASDTVREYLEEALRTYTGRNYMASAVMLGVAAEAAFLELTQNLCDVLDPTEAKKLPKWFGGTWRPYEQIREEFMRQLEPYRAGLPDAIKQNLDTQFVAVFALIRRYRSSVGHPTGLRIERGPCHLNLVICAEAAKLVYALKAHFDARAATP